MISKIITGFIVVFIAYYLKGFVAFLVDIGYKWWMCRNIPGPDSLPLIGSLHTLPKNVADIDTYLIGESHKVLNKGKNLMKIWYGPFLRVYLIDSEAVKVITNSNVEIGKNDDYEWLTRWMGDGLLISDGEKWKRNRKLMTPAFHFQKLNEYNEVIDYHIRSFVQILATKADGQEIDFIHYAKYATLDIIMQTAMGVHLNLQENNNHPYVKAVSRFGEFMLMRIMNPLYTIPIMWRILGYEKKTEDILKILKGLTAQIIEERIRQRSNVESETKRKPDFLDILLQQREENQMSVDELREEVDTFLFAGHDTTAHAISWTIWCLATNPEKQETLHKELIDNFGHSDAEFGTNKLKELKYLDAVIKESMRVYPAIPYIGRKLKNEVQIGEYKIPKGVSITIPQIFLHHNPNVFPNHWEFEPDNFLNGKEYQSNAYLPFSAGSRNCIGVRFAQNEIRITIAHLIYNFKFSSSHKMKDNFTSAEVVLRPGLGIPVNLEKRF